MCITGTCVCVCVCCVFAGLRSVIPRINEDLLISPRGLLRCNLAPYRQYQKTTISKLLDPSSGSVEMVVTACMFSSRRIDSNVRRHVS